MIEILDTIYSSFIIVMVIAIVLLFFFIALSLKNPFKNKFLNNFYKLLMYGCSFAFFISAQFFNYGHARGFENICISKKTICVFERSIPPRGRSSGKQARLNILDRETGVRKERINAGQSGVFIAMQNDTICYLDEQEVVLYDAANLKEIYRIKENDWATILPELNVGIDNIVVTNRRSDYNVKHYVQFDCLNGKKYWFEPFSKTISTKEPPALQYFRSFSNNPSELVVKLANKKELRYLYTSSIGQGRLEAILPGRNAKKYFSKIDSTGYIEPFLLCIDTVNKVFVFGHYLTTKKESYYLEAKDFNYTTKWKKLSSDLIDNDDQIIDVWFYSNNILYFNMAGYVFAIDPLTFKIYWTTRL
ncbi:MAG: hypothetical protein ABIP51_22715 [Bacteroidia bacterium]